MWALCCPQLEVIVRRGRRMRLQYAAARAALWLLTDLPAFVETKVLHSHSGMPVRRRSLEFFAAAWCWLRPAVSRQPEPARRT